MFAGLDGKPVTMPMSFKGYTKSLRPPGKATKPSAIPGSGDSCHDEDRPCGRLHGRLMTGAALAQAPAGARRAAAQARSQDRSGLGRALLSGSPAPARATCSRQLDDQQHRPAGRLDFSIAFYPSLNRHALVIAVPLEVSLPEGLTLADRQLHLARAANTAAATATAAIVEMARGQWRDRSPGPAPAATAARSISWPTAARPMTLNFSLKGFAARP